MSTIEAVIDENGAIELAEPIKLAGKHRALVTILDEPPIEHNETGLLSEYSLSRDWLQPGEDEDHFLAAKRDALADLEQGFDLGGHPATRDALHDREALR